MIYVAASVYDSAAKAFLPPFFVSNKAVAIRAFADIANQPDHQIGRNPHDFSLHIVGTFDDDSGVLHAYPRSDQVSLGLAANFIREPSSVQSKGASQPDSNEALVLTRAKGGNSAKQL